MTLKYISRKLFLQRGGIWLCQIFSLPKMPLLVLLGSLHCWLFFIFFLFFPSCFPLILMLFFRWTVLSYSLKYTSCVLHHPKILPLLFHWKIDQCFLNNIPKIWNVPQRLWVISLRNRRQSFITHMNRDPNTWVKFWPQE